MSDAPTLPKLGFALLLLLGACGVAWFAALASERSLESPEQHALDLPEALEPGSPTADLKLSDGPTAGNHRPRIQRNALPAKMGAVVRGRIMMPAGLPGDEELELYVWSGLKAEAWIRLPLQAGGTFVLPQRASKFRNFRITAHYLRLEKIEPELEGELLILRPELGARIVGHLEGVGKGKPNLFDVYLGRLPQTKAELLDRRGHKRPIYLRSLRSGNERFEFDAVPAGVPLVVEVHMPKTWPLRERIYLSPGETRIMTLEPKPGVTLAGVLSSPREDFDSYEYQLIVSLLRPGFKTEFVYSKWLNDPDGVFEINGLPAGKLLLVVQGPLRGSIELDTQPGDVIEDLNLDLGGLASISGRIEFEPKPGYDPFTEDRVVLKFRYPDGHMEWKRMRNPGFNYTLLKSGDRHQMQVVLSLKTAGVEIPGEWVEVRAPVTGLQLELPSTVTVSGRVVTSEDLSASALSVYADNGDLVWSGQSAEFQIQLSPQTRWLFAYIDHESPGPIVLLDTSSAGTLQGIVLHAGGPGSPITGIVLNADGAPAPEVDVEVWLDVALPLSDGCMWYSCQTDAEGRFEVEALPVRGSLSVIASQQTLQAEGPNLVDLSEIGNWAPGVQRQSSGKVKVLLGAGELRHVVLRMERL